MYLNDIFEYSLLVIQSEKMNENMLNQKYLIRTLYSVMSQIHYTIQCIVPNTLHYTVLCPKCIILYTGMSQIHYVSYKLHYSMHTYSCNTTIYFIYYITVLSDTNIKIYLLYILRSISVRLFLINIRSFFTTTLESVDCIPGSRNVYLFHILQYSYTCHGSH